MFGNKAKQTSSLARQVVMPGAQARQEPPALAEKRKVALFVAHGMGQQIPFETMDCVAEGIARRAREAGRPAEAIRAETCMVGGQKLQRIEMDLRDADGRPLELHIYEGYWAPFTEGQVTIMDVVSFLFRGGFNGLRNAWRDFNRWVFGGSVNFGKRPKTGLALSVALLVVASLVAANFVVTVMFADRLAGRIASPSGGGNVFADSTFVALTTLIAGWVLYSLAALALLGIAHKLRLAARPWTWALGLVTFGWLVYTIAIGVVPVLALLGWVNVDAIGREFFARHSIPVWVLLIALSWAIRGVLVQYPGDVAAYIATHTLDRFQEIRTRIKEAVGRVAKAIYATAEYEHVVWVGHSLGSVVVYDALNALIMDDELARQPLRALERTRLLVTFGSPLDKIAFIFASQWVNITETREALAASFQPLILDYYRFRRIRWVNIWSRADIISGDLDFFDDPAKANGRGVQNLIDPAASTPLLAHVEYWRNPLLFEHIYAGITQPAQAAAAR